MAERNYPCDNIILVYFGGNDTTLNQVCFSLLLATCRVLAIIT